MNVPAPKSFPPRKSLPLAVRRRELLAQIQIARADTAAAGRRVGFDLQVTERTRRTLLTSVKVLKASLVAAGVIWSFNATSRLARGSRLVTFAISMLSTARTLRKVGALFVPVTDRLPLPPFAAMPTTPIPLN